MGTFNQGTKIKRFNQTTTKRAIFGALVILPLLLLTNCTSNNGSEAGQAFLFSAPQGQMMVGSLVTVTYSGSKVSMAQATWTVTDPMGGSTPFSLAGDNAIQFLAQMGGTYTVTVSDGKSQDSSTVDVAQPPGTNTTFGFVLTIKDGQGNVVGVLSTDPTKNSGDYILKRGADYTLNFEGLPSGNTGLTFSISGAGVSGQGASIPRNCPTVAATPIVAKVTNADGQVNQVIYTEYCQCDAAANTMALDPTKITFSQSAGAPNVFSFDASAAVTGGTAPYLYNWAPETTLVYSGWTNKSPAVLGRVFSDSAPGALKVMDACYFVVGSVFTHAFDIHLADGVSGTLQGPQENNLQFIQGLLSGVNAAGQADLYVNNRNFIALKPIGPTFNAGVVVTPDYSINGVNGTFSLLGENIYVAADGTARDLLHGLSFVIGGIVENADHTLADATGAYITKVNYITDALGDGLATKTYVNQGNCPVNLTVTIQSSTTPCGDGTSASQTVRTMDGTYNCPLMVAQDGSQMSVHQGAFYAQVSKTIACAGGGGGGGGQPPRPR